MIINLDNFEEIVNPAVYDRGMECKYNKAIESIEEVETNSFNATVSGSQNYTVNVALSKADELLTFGCTCPFDSSAICKHIVAVLLLIKEKKKENKIIPKGDLFKISTKLEQFGKKELGQLLLELAKSDVNIRDRILYELGLAV